MTKQIFTNIYGELPIIAPSKTPRAAIVHKRVFSGTMMKNALRNLMIHRPIFFIFLSDFHGPQLTTAHTIIRGCWESCSTAFVAGRMSPLLSTPSQKCTQKCKQENVVTFPRMPCVTGSTNLFFRLAREMPTPGFPVLHPGQSHCGPSNWYLGRNRNRCQKLLRYRNVDATERIHSKMLR